MEIVPAAVALMAIIAIVWLSRAHATRRFNAALAVYAEREIRRHEAPVTTARIGGSRKALTASYDSRASYAVPSPSTRAKLILVDLQASDFRPEQSARMASP
jgi:hypothetical protein